MHELLFLAVGGSYGSVAGIYKCSNPSFTMLETQEARHGYLQYAVSWPQVVSITSILHYGHCSLPSAFHYAMQCLLLHKWAAQETPAELYNNRITLRFVIVDQSGDRLVPAAKIPPWATDPVTACSLLLIAPFGGHMQRD